MNGYFQSTNNGINPPGSHYGTGFDANDTFTFTWTSGNAGSYFSLKKQDGTVLYGPKSTSGTYRLAAAITGILVVDVNNTGGVRLDWTCAPGAASPSIATHPANASVSVGSNTTFTVTASDTTAYQWQVNSGSGFTNINNGAPYSGATTATLTITGATAGMSGYLYRVTATGSAAPSAISSAATLTVNSPPSISGQPSASAICAGANTTFSVAASNATGYQWQINSGSGFSNLNNGAPYSGATTATLTITGATSGMQGYLYRAIVSGLAMPNATSNGAQLTINSSPAITAHPSNETVLAGGNLTFSATASDATSYQWQESRNGGGSYSNIANSSVYSGATTSVLTISNANVGMNGYLYRLAATGTCSPGKTSNAATLTVVGPPTVTSVSPAAGTTAGGQSVAVNGTNFSTTPASNIVKFGTSAATVTAATATQLTVTTPAGSVGPVGVSVQVSGQTGTLGNAYTYVEPVLVGAVSATIAISSTNNAITLNMTGGAATSVAIGAAATHGTATVAGTAITYTPTSGYFGPDSFTYTATNAAGTSSAATVTITVSAPTVVLAPAAGALADGSIAASYNGTLTASGGTGPYSYAITSGALPDGVVLAANGVLSGTPRASGTFNFAVTATDSSTGLGPVTVSQSYSLTIAIPTIAMAPSSLSNATIASVYSKTITASGGTGPYSYAVVAGALPAGLLLNTNGTFSGQPTEGGTFNVTIKATDSSTGSGPHEASQNYALTVDAPTIAIAPAALSNATVGSPYSGSITASGGTAAYSYAVTSGTLPSGLILASDGTLSGTPTAGGAFNFTITATDSSTGTGPYEGSRAYALTVDVPTIAIAPATLSTATVGSLYSGSITASGGTGAYSYAVTSGTLPSGLLLAGDGTLSGTPTAGGTFNFTVTATDSSAGTGPYTGSRPYTMVVDAPTIIMTPAAGALPVGTTGVAYNQPVSASGGTSPYAYTVTSGALPAGLTLSSDGVLDGTPTASGNSSFTVTATDAYGSTGSVTYALAVGFPTVALTPAPGALPAGTTGVAYNQTLSASGGTSPYAYTVTSGALPAGLTLSSAGLLGGAPTSTGNSSFTVMATDAYGATTSATYTLDVHFPTVALTPAAGTLPGGTIGTAYSLTLSASAGSAPYAYAVTSGTLPAGLTLDGNTGALSGTPTTKGSSGFAVTATDAHGAAVTAAYTLAVDPPTVTFAFTPAAGGLKEAMEEEEYSQPITVAGGTAPYLYRISSGALPPGLVLNVSTGELTGTPTAGSEGTYSFTLEVEDANSAMGSVSHTLAVKPRTITAADKMQVVAAGSSPRDEYLNKDATGGPFTDAVITSVTPPEAGTAQIIQGQLAQVGPVTSPVGWYLQFTPNPAFSGTARVGYVLTSALGTSNLGTVTYHLGYNPQTVADDIDALVHGFVETRQGLIASSIKVPGLMERRQLENATGPVTARMTPSEEGMTARFSTSLAQMEAARDAADGVEGGASSPFNIWIDGTLMAHRRDQNDGRWGSFAMLNIGADYLLSEKALVGFSFHLDRMTDPTKEDAELTGNGWFAGPYASFEIGKGVFWDTSLLYGGSANDIDTAFWDGSFETKRWMIDTSIKGEWQIDEVTVLTPMLRAVYFNEAVEDYTVRNAAGDELTIEGFDAEQFRVSLGAEIARSFTLENGATLTPKLGVTAGYSGLDGSGAYGTLTAGLAMETADFWILEASLLLNVEGDGQKSVGGRIRAAKQF